MYKLRLRFTKDGTAKYISHLDLMQVFRRAFLRIGLELAYSGGFHPHMQMNILLPLSTGFSSQCELLDLELAGDALPEDLARMNAARERIPAPLLEKVFRIRRRNLAVTLAGAELAADGLLAGLSILQEDCQEYGLPCQDQRAAESRLRELGLREQYPIRNGKTDSSSDC